MENFRGSLSAQLYRYNVEIADFLSKLESRRDVFARIRIAAAVIAGINFRRVRILQSVVHGQCGISNIGRLFELLSSLRKGLSAASLDQFPC